MLPLTPQTLQHIKSYLAVNSFNLASNGSETFKILLTFYRRATQTLIDSDILARLMRHDDSKYVEFFIRIAEQSISDDNQTFVSHLIDRGLVRYLATSFPNWKPIRQRTRRMKIQHCLHQILDYDKKNGENIFRIPESEREEALIVLAVKDCHVGVASQ